jgi:hypothetical protein
MPSGDDISAIVAATINPNVISPARMLMTKDAIPRPTCFCDSTYSVLTLRGDPGKYGSDE